VVWVWCVCDMCVVCVCESVCNVCEGVSVCECVVCVRVCVVYV